MEMPWFVARLSLLQISTVYQIKDPVAVRDVQTVLSDAQNPRGL